MKSRNLSRRPISRDQKRRSFLRWLRPLRQELDSSRKLQFESLEDRRVLATFYVDNSAFGVAGVGQGTFTPNGGDQIAVSGLTLGTDLFTTIGAAVSAAAANAQTDIINVADGTFAEQVAAAEAGLIFQGNQFLSDGRDLLRGTETIVTGSGNGGLTPFSVTASDVQIAGFTVEGATNGTNLGFGIVLGAGTAGSEVRNNIIQNNIAGLSLANNNGSNQTVIERNLFRNNNQPGPVSGTGIYTDQFNAGGTLTNVLIDNNTFSGNNGPAVNLSSTLPGSQSNVTVSNNTMTNNGNGVLFFNTTNSSVTGNTITGSVGTQVGIFDGSSGITVANNFIENGQARGIRVDNFGGGSNSNVTINNNSIQNNAGNGLEVASGAYTGTLNAENNYWGSPTGPTTPENPGGTGDEIVAPAGQVDFSPFLPSGTDAQPGTPGFQPTPGPTGVAVLGTSGNDLLEVFAGPGPNTGFYQLNGGPLIPFAGITSFSFAALGGNDIFRVNNPTGGLFAPVNGIFYDGGTQTGVPGDSLAVLGGQAVTETFTFTPDSPGSQHNGTIALVNGATTANYTYTNLAPVLVNAGSPTDVIFNLPSTANPDVVIGDDLAAAANTSEIRGSTFEATAFTNPTGSLTVNGTGTNSDTVTLLAMDPAFAPGGAAPFSVFTSDGNDTVNVLNTKAGITTTVDTGTGISDAVFVGVSSGAVNTGVGSLAGIAGNLVLNDNANHDISIDNGADVASRTWTIDAPAANRGRFAISGIGGTITYDTTAGNTVSAFAGSGNDAFTVNFNGVNASDPLPFLNLRLFGNGGAADSLAITGNPVGPVVNTPTGPGSGTFRFTAFTPFNDLINYSGMESASITNADSVTVEGDAANNTLTLRRIALDTFTYQLDANPVVTFTRPTSAGTQFQFNGNGGDDTYIVDNGSFSAIVNLRTAYNGGTNNAPGTEASGPPGDTMVITGTPIGGAVAARTTYIVGASQDAGTYVVDPNGNKGAGANAASDGDELTVAFTGLEPIDDDTPAAIFDIILSAGADVASIDNDATLNGANAMQVTDLGGTFETTRFANKTTVRVMGSSGADRFRLNFTIAAAGLTTLEVYGHVAGDVVGQPADDNLDDNFELDRTGGGIVNNVFGQGGSDGFSNDAQAIVSPLFGAGPANLDNITGTLNINGGGGGSNGAADSARLHDFNDATADLVTIDNVSPTVGRITGATPALITHTNLDSLLFEGSGAGDTINVLATLAGTSYYVTGNGGPDTITIGNQTADFNSTFDGSLTNILGPIIVTGEFNPPSAGAIDTLNVDASGDAALAGAASIGINPAFAASFFGSVDSGAATELLNFAPAPIRYRHTVSSATTPDATYNNRIEFVNVLGSTGNDNVIVNATTATNTTTINTRQGDDTVTISGDNLSANNLFQGFDGNDLFSLNVAANIGATAFVTTTSLQIEGNNAPGGGASNSTNRDRLTVTDSNAEFARNLNYHYVNAASGDIDIAPAVPGSGLAGGVVPALAVQVRTMETVIFNSPGGTNDVVTVTGTASNDLLTAALRPNNSSALVFRDGTPYLNAPPVTIANSRPGVAGGSAGPDLLINGMSPATGITLDGGGIPAGGGDRAIVYAASETNLTDVGNPTDIFGFGAGILQPGFGVGNAYDTINVTDSTVTTTNNAFGPLTTVHLIVASFVQGTPPSASQQAALIVNGGDEATPQASGVADNFTVTPSTNYNIQVNGNLPVLTTVSGVPQGDQLNVAFPGSINVFSDAASPPNVTITGQTSSGGSPFGVQFSSIERTNLTPGNGIVNIIGDNNNPAVTQNDYFKVRGAIDVFGIPGVSTNGSNQFSLQIGGGWDPATGNVGAPPPSGGLSAPIFFYGVTRINASGGEATGFDIHGNAIPQTVGTGIDALDITPYADNTPRGWGIETYFNEGDPDGDGGQPNPDLLIFNGVFGVSENIVVQPSASMAGQVYDNNAATNTPIAVVNYVLNTNIIVNGSSPSGTAGDTDTLTLNGTDPASPGTSGRDTFAIDLTRPGTAGNELVVVTDTATAAPLYNIENFTNFSSLNVNTLAGTDTVSLVNRAGTTVNIDGGSPISGDTLTVTVPGNARFTQGARSTEGLIDNSTVGDINIANFELVNINSAAAASTLTIRGTDDNDNIAVGLNGITAAWINDGAVVGYNSVGTNFTSVIVQGRFGNDTFSVTPHAGVAITVQGGDPTASDTVVVNGTAGLDAINYSPTGADAGTVQVNALGLVTLATVEHLTINGLGGGDNLTVTTVGAGGHLLVLNDGPLADAGSVEIRDAAQLLGMSFSNIGLAGTLTFANAVRADKLEYNGRDLANASERFGVSAAGRISLDEPTTGPFNKLLVDVLTPGVAILVLNGLAGDDIFNIAGNHPFTGGIIVDGGDPSASDTLNFTGAGAAVTVDLAGLAVSEVGFSAVSFTGIEVLNVNAGAGAISVNGTAGPDNLTATPTGATTATVTAAGVNLTINTTNAGTLTINPAAGSDNLAVYGTQNGEIITVTSALVTVGVLKPVAYVNTENLQVFAQAGSDTIDVTPSLTTTIFIDGGDPIGNGATPADTLILHPVGLFAVEPGPENDEGGLFNPPNQRVSWDHIEQVTVIGVPGPGPGIPGLMLGTNGDDDITIIARDASTHLGADGVQDFTVSVNDGPEILFLNMPVFLVDALAGDDDIVVREPAPNNAVWNVQLFISGGTPAAPTGDQGDVVELETPGTQTVIFTPNPAAFVIPGLLPGLTLTVPAPSGIDTAILNDTTNASIIAITPFSVSALGIPIYNSSPGGAEQIVYQGLAGGDNLTINGTASDDTTTLNPTGQGSGSFRSGLSPTFDFTGATVLTVNPGTGGFDRTIVNGTEGADVVTSTATTITLGGTVTLGAGMDRLDLNTLGGNDSVTLSLAVTGLAKFIDAGAGNDTVNLTAVAVDPVDPTIFGGDGDDLLIGSPNPDLIFGGRGNDTIIGAGGADVEYGEDGNDLFGDQLLGVGGIGNGVVDDAGNDQLFGGAGSDRFVWDPGDGSDTIEGGAGESDQMIFFGSAGAETFTFTQVGTRLSFTRSLGGIVMDAAGIDQFTLQTGGGADIINVNDISQTDVRSIDINLANADGTADGAVDATTVFGREVADSVAILASSAGLLAITGLKYDINIRNAAAANDVFTFNAVGGNDTLVTADDLSAQFTTANFTVNGGLGNDTISGYGTLNGNEGDDTLVGGSLANVISGGAGNDTVNGGGGGDTLNGNDGNDTFIGGTGNDTIDGGNDYDTILVLGTPSNDLITANQTAATSVTYTVTPTVGTASVETDTLVLSGGVRTVEELRILADAGDDNILVTAADVLGTDAAVNSLIFNVDGGPATTRDRLSVQDNGTGDLVLYRRGTTDDAGSVTVGPGNAEPLETVFFNVERVDPVAGVGGAIRVFKHDSLEWNDDVANATFLGADETINVDPNIDPGALIVPGFATVPADNDFFRVVAEKTGTLDFQVYFSQLATVTSGRPGLPNAGNLEIELYDVDGTLIVDSVAGGITPEFGVNDATDNERIRIPAVAGQTYYLRVFPNGIAINTYSITTINTAAPVPFDIELLDTPINTATNSVNGTPVGPTAGLNSDTGRSRFDDITFDNDPTILIRVPHVVQVLGVSFLEDIPANGSGAPGSPPDETILIPFVTSTLTNAPSAGFRVAVFVTENNTTDAVFAGYAQPIVGRPGVFTFTFANDALVPDGSYFISASVEMIDPTAPEQNQGFGELAESLEAIVDTILPPASFGSPGVANDGLILSDECPTPLFNLTNIARPTFWGRAEADTVINLYLDSNNNGAFDPVTDVFLGQTVATPFDGGDQYPNGYWEIESRLSLNDPSLVPPLPFDGPRTLFVTAEDVAGNITGSPTAVVQTTLQIVIDTQGPQVTDVDINNAGNGYDLFDPKPSTDGPTPLVNSIVISFQDLPPRVAGTLYVALEAGTVVPGNFRLVGDYNGIIPIQSIILVNNPPVAGSPATATVELVFFSPLPDDRFTLTVEDSVTDPLCNKLNGESNASEPQENPTFPSGDDHAGGDFVARFTVDSRPEVGTWGAGAAWIDTNGNTTFDQNNADYTNRDITYYLGYTSDNLFAGNFIKAAGGVADGFDKLAAYGKVGGSWRFLVDVNNDGVITPGVDIAVVDPAGINGVPVAGNFDGNAANGDEVGIFTGTTWYFDTNHDFKVELGSAVAWSVNGYPVVGNFDGVAGDDLATYRDNTFFLDFGRNGSINATFRFGFPTPNNRPVSADMDQDGNDDLGLFVPNRAGVSPSEDAEWYILVSDGAPISSRIHADPIDGVPVIDYKPVPFGNDLYIEYGDQFGLPILGNFDPPVTPGGSTSVNFPSSNPNNPLDVNNDGFVTPIDALLVINEINANGSHALDTSGFHTAPFIDTDKDNVVSPHDVLLIINKLNAPPAGSPGAEGESLAPAAAHDAVFSQLGAPTAPPVSVSTADVGILSLLADDQLRAKRSRQAE